MESPMKNVFAGSFAILLMACACAPRVAVPPSEAQKPRPPVPRLVEAEVARPPASMAALPLKPVRAETPARPKEAAPGPALEDGRVEECSHILGDVGRAADLLGVRSEGASTPATLEAVAIWLRELESLDGAHPNLHHALKVRVARVSTQARRVKELLEAEECNDAELEQAGRDLTVAITAVGDLCAPHVEERGEAS